MSDESRRGQRRGPAGGIELELQSRASREGRAPRSRRRAATLAQVPDAHAGAVPDGRVPGAGCEAGLPACVLDRLEGSLDILN